MHVIIPCGAKKRPFKCAAKDLYIGTYFKANLNWAISVCNKSNILILSAKHGLIELDTAIEPYDQFMGDAGSVDPNIVKEQAKKYDFKKVYALGGSKYLACLDKAGIEYIAPVRGKSMGIQIALLKKNIGRLP